MRHRFTCVAAVLALVGVGGAQRAEAQLRGEQYVVGLSAPVSFVQDPSDPTVQFVVQQGGLIRVIKNGALVAMPFLDLSTAIGTGGERGLLGMALAPDYATSRRFFVNFTNTDGHTVIARFMRSAGNPLVADTARFDLRWSTGQRWIPQPASNHNGGHLAFGPDGYLYIGLGDGGGAHDPFHLAQSPNNLLGKMLRIDVDVPDADPEGFDIPADNPFLDGVPVVAQPEIWSFGLRNPWKYSFDDPALGGNGALIIADVGQARWEEINYEPTGRPARNYGWRNYEGARSNVTTESLAYGPPVMPAFEYDHSEGGSISGGYVYRGSLLNAGFRGRYFFADFTSGRVWSIRFDLHAVTGEGIPTDLREHTSELAVSGGLGLITGFGVDSAGELYVISFTTGRIIRILGTSDTFAAAVPLPAADLNEDFLGDIIWQNESDGYLATWLMNGSVLSDSLLLHPNREADAGWKIVATPRMNPDFKTDIVWQHQQSGYVALWTMNGRTIVESVLFEPPQVADTGWKIVASGDVNGDGKTDLIWRHERDGWIAAWLMDGIRLIESVSFSPAQVADTNWTIVGAGDFNGNGHTDLVWWHRTEGWVVVWRMNRTALASSVATSVERVPDVNWTIAGVWDFNRDGQSDLIWQNRTEGWIATWRMNGLVVADSLLLTPSRVPDPGWRIVGPK